MKEILLIDDIKNIINKNIISTIYEFDNRKHDVKKLKNISKVEPLSFFELSMSVWNRIIQYNYFDVDPQALAKEVDKQEPNIYMKISEIIGEPIIKEILFCESHIEDPNLEYNIVHDIMVGRVYPNDLHLADIVFSNPYKPIESSLSKSINQHYKGFGLLGKQISTLIEYGKKYNCDYITLTASTMNEYHLFSKHGFALENNTFAKKAFEFHVGIPMELRINVQ